MNFRNLQAGTTIKFYNNWSDQYTIGEIISEKNSGYQVAIKSRVASQIFVESNDIVDVIDKQRKFEPVVEEIIEEQPIVEEIIEEQPIVEEVIIEEQPILEPILEPIVEEIVEIKEPVFKGLFADGGTADYKLINGLPNELTIFIPLFDMNGKPASDNEIEDRVDDVKDFLKRHFGEFVVQDMGSSYIDREGNLIMRKTIQISAYPSDSEFNYHKQHLINQLSLWASEWGQDFMILEYEDEMFFILGLDDMMKQGGELWIQDAVSQMKKKGTIGAFTKQAKREGLTPIAFAKKVLKNPKGYTLKTRRRANFVRNVNPDKF
jgi:hypothetical protein